VFDSHCHLHDDRMAADREAALTRARAAGVRGFLLAGVLSTGWAIEAELALRHPDLAIAYGVHPQLVAELDDEHLNDELSALAQALAGQGPKALPRPHAIGEIGLDALDAARRASIPRQERAFRAQLALARSCELPIVLHILRTQDAALRILKRDGVPRCGGVVHSYSGSAELVPAYLALGLHISFAGAVTYPHARRLQEAARAVPLDRLLVETDAPDQTPFSHRPGPNEPAFLGDVLDALAIIRAEDRATLARATENNARRLLGLPPAG
jgi:TatD DNase family protein